MSKLNGIVKIEQQEVFVTASIGIAIFPEDGEAPETLLMNADTAMYRAKERGKNNFQFFTSDMNTSTMERMRLEIACTLRCRAASSFAALPAQAQSWTRASCLATRR